MILTLEITGPQAEKLGAIRRKVFNATGGTIGRLPDNYWALPDPYISSRHALIRYRDGVFYIEDTSTNGVFVNSQDNRLVKGQPHALKSGDWIFIEPYEIRASITGPVKEAASTISDLFPASSDNPFAPPSAVTREPFVPPFDHLPEPIPDDELDPMKKLGFGPTPSRPNSPKLADLAGQSTLKDHYQPPGHIETPSEQPPGENVPFIPAGYNPLDPFDDSGAVPQPVQKALGDSRVPPPRRDRRPVSATPSAAPSPPLAPPPKEEDVPGRSRGAVDLHAVLLGAGLENIDVTPELARSFGEILRVVVAGLIDVLRARSDLKNEFRMDMTMYRQTANNPLKHSVNVDDALHNLLVKRNAAFLGPVEAFEDAFDDVRNHQLGMLAGMHAAFDALLAEFDPQRLQADFDRQLKKGALLSAPAKLRYWDLYREKFHGMVKDPERCFRELFGNEFAEAYEEQLKRLKGQGRAPKR
jgi:type VI secretion system FHA domain protein